MKSVNLTKKKESLADCACFTCPDLTSHCDQYPAESTRTYER